MRPPAASPSAVHEPRRPGAAPRGRWRRACATARLRLGVRLRHWRLDRELADGVAASASARHALRAAQLTRPATRAALARSLRAVVARAQDPFAALSGAVPVRRAEVGAWAQGLLGLAERLERNRPVSPQGMARVRLLVSDGLGPLYNSHSELTLGEAIWRVADGLETAR
jgi:hypothetical protein